MMRVRTTLGWSALIVAVAVGLSLWMSAWPRLHDAPTEAAVAARVRARAQAPRAMPREARHRLRAATPVAATAAPTPAPPVATLAPVYAPSPSYPMEALRNDRGGVVTLQVSVDGQGSVTGVAVARSSGDAALDASAQAAVRRWRFEAPRDGAGITFDYPVTFRVATGPMRTSAGVPPAPGHGS